MQTTHSQSRLHTLTVLILVSLLMLSPGNARADLVLETETAELGIKGEWLVSCALQWEKAPDGKGLLTVNQFEYAITDRAEILIEPFFYEWAWPKGETKYGGIGDLEITPSYMVVVEGEKVPAIVAAMKLKVPTATNRDIGNGKVDYQPYLIFGKKFGENWIWNANLGLDIVGQVANENLKNQFIYDMSIERKITDNFSVFAEIFGNTKVAAEEKGTFAGAIATEYQLSKHSNVYLSAGYDTDHLFNIRPGFNIHF